MVNFKHAYKQKNIKIALLPTRPTRPRICIVCTISTDIRCSYIFDYNIFMLDLHHVHGHIYICFNENKLLNFNIFYYK